MRPARQVTALLTALPMALLALLQSHAAPAAAAAISIAGVGGSASASEWKRQPCAANVPGNDADIVTRWGATVDPAKAPPLQEHPRPQLVRAHDWLNLNGLWQWEPGAGANGTAAGPPPFGKPLSRSILVPFPAESCLSGIRENHPYQWYRLVFNLPGAAAGASSAAAPARWLHFGAVDWQAKVWLNKQLLGSHTGGYDGFSFPIGDRLQPENNELLVFVYDPSELGAQPFGKQRAASIAAPGTDGEKYTPAAPSSSPSRPSCGERQP